MGLTSWCAVARRRSWSGSSTRGIHPVGWKGKGQAALGLQTVIKLGTSLNRGGVKIGASDLRVDQVLGRVNWNARWFYEGFVALQRVVKIHPPHYQRLYKFFL